MYLDICMYYLKRISFIKMEAFINVIKKDPFVCMKINNMLDRYNRLTYDRKDEIVYDSLLQNIILKELINIMSIMISDLDGIKNED